MKLQSFESDTSDANPTSVHNISLLLFTAYFCHFYQKKASDKVYDVFDHFLQSYESTKPCVIGHFNVK